MSDRGDSGEENVPKPEEAESESAGPNLVLLYSLLAAALIAAVIFAMAIVRPFYLNR